MSQGQFKFGPAAQVAGGARQPRAVHPYKKNSAGGGRKNTDRKSRKPQGKITQLLAKIPYALGIVLCVGILALSLVTGNARALNKANSSAMKAWQVTSYTQDRVGKAKNLLKLCERYTISEELVTALNDAVADMGSAKGVRGVTEANSTLQTAASNVSSALLSGNLSSGDEKSLKNTMDDFNEQNNFIRQQARTYNEKAQKALDVYNSLPTKFLLKAPEVADL